MQAISLDFTPWPHQLPSLQARKRGYKRRLKLWHRRAGKDLSSTVGAVDAAQEEVGIYYHMFPELAQGRKILWDGMDNTGRRFLDYIPKALIKGKPNETEMQVEFQKGVTSKPIILVELGFPDGMSSNTVYGASKVTDGMTAILDTYTQIKAVSLWSNHASWLVNDVFPYDCLFDNPLQVAALQAVVAARPGSIRSCVTLTDGIHHPNCIKTVRGSGVVKSLGSVRFQ